MLNARVLAGVLAGHSDRENARMILIRKCGGGKINYGDDIPDKQSELEQPIKSNRPIMGRTHLSEYCLIIQDWVGLVRLLFPAVRE